MDFGNIELLIKQANGSVHFECTSKENQELVNKIRDTYANKKISFVFLDDAMYSFFTVKEYLLFYSDITDSDCDLFGVAELLHLHPYLHQKIKKLTSSVKKLVQIAGAFMTKPDLLVLEDPLKDLEQEDAKLLVGVIDQLPEQGMTVITTSPSFRNVVLMPGNTYHIKDGTYIPIYESLDAAFMSHSISQQSDLETLEIKTKGRELFITVADIYYAESIDSVCHVYVKNSLVPTTYTLEELEQKLQRFHFFRSHRSYLVNVSHVSEIQQWTRNSYALILDSEKNIEIPLSKRRYQEFKALLHSEPI